MAHTRDVEIVAGLRRRLANADAVTLTNFAWFAARRGGRALALEAVTRAQAQRHAPSASRINFELLSAGTLEGLLLAVVPDAITPETRTVEEVTTRDEAAEAELLNRGRHLLESGRLSDALLAFDRLLHIYPSHTAALFHRGVVLAKLRRYGEALTDWESVGHADPDGPLGAISRRHARSARELASLFVVR